MPVTPNEAAKGQACGMCGGPATHAYGDIWICCDCHTGEPGGGLYAREQADRIHKGLDPFTGEPHNPTPPLLKTAPWDWY